MTKTRKDKIIKLLHKEPKPTKAYLIAEVKKLSQEDIFDLLQEVFNYTTNRFKIRDIRG